MKKNLINGNNRYKYNMMHSVIIVKFLSSTYLVTILKALHPPMTSVYNIYIPHHIHISYIYLSGICLCIANHIGVGFIRAAME